MLSWSEWWTRVLTDPNKIPESVPGTISRMWPRGLDEVYILVQGISVLNIYPWLVIILCMHWCSKVWVKYFMGICLIWLHLKWLRVNCMKKGRQSSFFLENFWRTILSSYEIMIRFAKSALTQTGNAILALWSGSYI